MPSPSSSPTTSKRSGLSRVRTDWRPRRGSSVTARSRSEFSPYSPDPLPFPVPGSPHSTTSASQPPTSQVCEWCHKEDTSVRFRTCMDGTGESNCCDTCGTNHVEQHISSFFPLNYRVDGDEHEETKKMLAERPEKGYADYVPPTQGTAETPSKKVTKKKKQKQKK